MTIRVSDILHIDKLQNAVMLAGRNGLNREIRRVASIERPYVDHPEYSFKVARPGDIYISKLYVFEGQIEKFYEELEFQHLTGGSGLITHKQMISFIDQEAIRRADAYRIPIIAVDDEIGLTELIFDVMDLVIKDRITKIQVSQFEHLLQNDLSDEEVGGFIRSLDLDVRQFVQILFVQADVKLSGLLFEIRDTDLLLPIYGGFLCLLSDEDPQAVTGRKEAFLYKFRSSYQRYTIGVSAMGRQAESVKRGILEAICAFVYGKHTGSTVSDYDGLREFGLAAELRGN